VLALPHAAVFRVVDDWFISADEIRNRCSTAT
jgi:hypothetical protein